MTKAKKTREEKKMRSNKEREVKGGEEIIGEGRFRDEQYRKGRKNKY